MYQEMRTKDDAWMQSIHESIDQLSEILDSMPKDGAALQQDDEYLCDKEVAYMLKEEFYKLKYCSTVVYMVPRA